MIRKEDADTALQLFSNGMVWDGDLVSKDSRSALVRAGYAVRVQGWQALTGRGVFAVLCSPRVWILAFMRWYQRRCNRRFAPPV